MWREGCAGLRPFASVMVLFCGALALEILPKNATASPEQDVFSTGTQGAPFVFERPPSFGQCEGANCVFQGSLGHRPSVQVCVLASHGCLGPGAYVMRRGLAGSLFEDSSHQMQEYPTLSKHLGSRTHH